MQPIKYTPSWICLMDLVFTFKNNKKGPKNGYNESNPGNRQMASLGG